MLAPKPYKKQPQVALNTAQAVNRYGENKGAGTRRNRKGTVFTVPF
jgi:hypothetical protein